ncbi:MAG: transposase zinc-binding domain-containing protein [Verrucomicrobia bacterium]|nr:transposase zinc-binding domain-containing protein [Verrucomicrobiota bacterium]
MGPLRPNVFAVVRNFLRCGDRGCGVPPQAVSGASRPVSSNAAGHLCPACHQRRARQTAGWIASGVCHEVPHRQLVFTIPKILNGIFRKRRNLLHLLFKTATNTLLEAFRARLNLPDDEPPDRWDQRPHPAWHPVEIPLDDERTLVLEATYNPAAQLG